MSLMTVEGLYNYKNTLFSEFEVPNGMDKQIAIDTICMRSRELEVLYPNLEFFSMRIGMWSRKNQYNWKKLYDTTLLEYNPIENYDRMEDWTETDSETGTNSRNNDIRNTISNEVTNSGNVTEQNTAFNAGLADHAKEISNNNTNSNGSGSTTENESGTSKRDLTHKRTGRTHGNIGVTTSQQMIQSEREVAMFNIYDIIAESFVENFCLMVY